MMGFLKKLPQLPIFLGSGSFFSLIFIIVFAIFFGDGESFNFFNSNSILP